MATSNVPKQSREVVQAVGVVFENLIKALGENGGNQVFSSRKL